ncbi:11501_t:CDS:1 [Paraglomus brasilianum]|uniref:11501_t:CDS:1 n=1 Tax=Paraglomus brasilianum TaxID=144538 RepID=A0A9N9CV46_9GLOM|nr:11501_t:CDS:1 [Paraglomus brasilianum]
MTRRTTLDDNNHNHEAEMTAIQLVSTVSRAGLELTDLASATTTRSNESSFIDVEESGFSKEDLEVSLTALHQTLQKLNKLASNNVQSALDNELESGGFIVVNINSHAKMSGYLLAIRLYKIITECWLTYDSWSFVLYSEACDYVSIVSSRMMRHQNT